jgi:signal transduction histidine kinase/PleD family two-component response regulator
MDKIPDLHQVDGAIRVMVVDDHPGTAATLARAIAQLGSRISSLSATSGQQALKQASISAVDILITDMMMPEMNGLELIEQMQAHPAGRPACTILMTAYDVPGLKESARRLNVSEILIKPIPPERVCRIVSNVMEESGITHSPQPIPGSCKPFTILIADDYPDNLSLLSRYLQKEGYLFLTAEDGLDALAKARSEMPDLILLDVNMPRMDGLKVVQALRADPATEHIPVIILTAMRIGPSDVQTGLNLGADDYITKPFDRLELMARIRTKLRVKNAEDRIRQRNRELSVLPEIGRELSARLDLNEITNLVLKRSVEILGALTGHLVILNSKSPFHKEYHLSKNEPLPHQNPIPLFNGLVEEIRERPESTVIEDAENDPRWQKSSILSGSSVMIVPISGRFELIGILILTHEGKGYFSHEHLVLTQAIASQAGIALDNCRLYTNLSKEQGRISAVLNSAADGILLFDADGCLSIINPTAKLLFAGYDVRPGLPLALGQGFDLLIESLEKAFDSGQPHRTEILWPDRRIFTADFTPLADGGCVLLLHDVSHFKTLERVKDEFIATASHDLRNPITSIMGFSQLVLQGSGLNGQQVDFVQRILHAAENMTGLVDSMLDLAKIDLQEERKFETFDFAPLLAKIADEFKPQAEAKSQALTLEKTDRRLEVQGDALKLGQALRNLVGNAIKYTPRNGNVKISTAVVEHTMAVCIRDTGYGIPAADLPNLFKRFYRVRNNGHDEIEGSGLGLAIVKSVIEGHGGHVSVESEPGKGSCFTLSLPLAAEI